MKQHRLPAALCAFVALVGALLWHPHEPDAQTSRVPVYATSATTLTSTGRALAVATNAAAARSALSLGTLATASSVAATDISDSTSVGRSVLTGTASDGRTALGLGSLATASSVASTSISDSTATGRSLVTATDAAAARTTLSAVSTARTIAGSDLTADISAATLRSGLSLPAAAPALSTSGRLVYLLADSIGGSDGSAVSSWTDSVSSRSAVQATSANQPLFYSGASGEGIGVGRAVVRCDGTNDRLTIAGEAALDVSTLTLYLVARARRNSGSTLPASVVIIQRPYDLAGSSPYSEIGFWVPNSSQIEYRADGTASSYASVGNTGSDWATPHVLVLTVGAGGSSLHVDGVRQATSATTSVAYNTANLNWALCADGYTTAGEWWRGDIGAVALYSGAHTSAQRRANEGALCMYYGLVCASGDT